MNREVVGDVAIEDGGSRWVMWGEIDFSVTHRVKRALASTIDGFPKTIDLRRVTFMDSSGLHLLLMKVTAASRPRLVDAPQPVLDLLDMSSARGLVELVDGPHDDGASTPGGTAVGPAPTSGAGRGA
ncbi:STAS domain-containing protein [Cellulosimicrobium sp. Marseille-Q4280]|uniref:STAS domain-containing protein n=1 Tax=Cellulosimicrobium sp. Marseille-Q4280 TaxID=2937992 RepID=UPI0020402203|nr:STAS domain-containing protein [Cellulosimicrobium sp. Marseille-Q4280]